MGERAGDGDNTGITQRNAFIEFQSHCYFHDDLEVKQPPWMCGTGQ